MKKILVLLFVAFSIAYSDDEMSLHVSVVDPDMDSAQNDLFINAPSESTFKTVLDNTIENEKQPIAEDLCSKLKCGVGETCIIDESQAKCECIEICEIPKDERQKICTTSNQTFDSDCHFLRQKCWCNKNDVKCLDSSILKDKLDYYGACRSIEKCTEEQKRVFPGRMKIWLDEVLHILNERKDLDPKFMSLVKLADEMKANEVEKYWTCGVAFEFCQLDKSKDHIIQKEELRSLISPIKALENCIQPFLDECDTDNNDVIDDEEWGHCLGLSEDDMGLLRKYC